MKRLEIYLLYQLGRFQVMTFGQISQVALGQASRARIYNCLKSLRQEGFVRPIYVPGDKARAYSLTEKGQTWFLGDSNKGKSILRERDLSHTLLCAQSLISASTRSKVTGIVGEAELDPWSLSQFCLGRRPDGILQIKRESGSFEVALEVESSKRSMSRTSELLDSYEQTFRKQMLCRGVLIVAATPSIHSYCFELIGKRAPEIQQRILLLSDPTLKELNSAIYGNPEKNPRICLEKSRTVSKQGADYKSIFSTIYGSESSAKRPHRVGSDTDSVPLEVL